MKPLNACLHDSPHCSFAIVLTVFRRVDTLVKSSCSNHPTNSLPKKYMDILFHNMPSAAPESGSIWRAASKYKCLRTILNKRCRRGNPMPTLDSSVYKNVCRLDFYLIFIQQDCWTQILSQSVVTG